MLYIIHRTVEQHVVIVAIFINFNSDAKAFSNERYKIDEFTRALLTEPVR